MPKLDESQIERLVSAAWEARMYAYAPYSQFRVGAALMAADGRIFIGANVENASYGLSMCAERVAVGSAASAGARTFVAIAVAGESAGGLLPCGACTQVLAEFSRTMLVISCHRDGTYETVSLERLVPSPFSGRALDVAVREPRELVVVS